MLEPICFLRFLLIVVGPSAPYMVLLHWKMYSPASGEKERVGMGHPIIVVTFT